MTSEFRMHPRRVLVFCLLVVATVIATAWVRANVESRQEFERAQVALQQGDEPSAVLHLRRSAQWHAPCCTPARDALDQLVAIGDAAAYEGRVDDALFAWRSARNAIFAVRHLVVPHKDLLDQLHPRIAEAMGVQSGRTDDGSVERWHAQLDGWRDRRASLPHAAGGGLAFWASLGCFAGAFLRGVQPDGALRREFGRWCLAGLVLTALWIFLVYRA
jgi:hypothetical protein